MSKDIAAQEAYQGTAIGSGTLASSLLVMKGLQDIEGSFDRLCLRAGLAAIEAILASDAETLCGKRYTRGGARRGPRRGHAPSEIDCHGGKATVSRPLVWAGGAKVELASQRHARCQP